MSELRAHQVRRCPKCSTVTSSYEHCFVKGPPLIPQLDDYTVTEPATVVVVDELLAWLRNARRYDPATGRDRRMNGWAGAADELERELAP